MSKEKELSEEDAKKLEELNRTAERYEKEGYRREDLIETSGVAVNVKAFFYGLIVSAPLILIFILTSRDALSTAPWRDIAGAFMFLGILLVLVVVHELIHGLFFGMFSGNGYKDVAFGFNVRAFAPYCTCSEPLKKAHYLIAGLMPCILLGVIPSIVGILMHDLFVFEIAILMIFGAGGDLLIAKMILTRKAGPESMYLDHPVHIGCVLLEK